MKTVLTYHHHQHQERTVIYGDAELLKRELIGLCRGEDIQPTTFCFIDYEMFLCSEGMIEIYLNRHTE